MTYTIKVRLRVLLQFSENPIFLKIFLNSLDFDNSSIVGQQLKYADVCELLVRYRISS